MGGPKFRAFSPLLPPCSLSFFSPCASSRPPGFHTTAREPKRAHLRVLDSKTPPTFHEKTPEREREKKKRKWRHEREKQEQNVGQSGGGGPSGGRVRWRGSTHAPPTPPTHATPRHATPPHPTKRNWPKENGQREELAKKRNVML